MHARQIAMLKTTKRGIESLGLADIKELLVILKADVQGSVEVLKQRLKNFRPKKSKYVSFVPASVQLPIRRFARIGDAS